jgi:hypothetical protein
MERTYLQWNAPNFITVLIMGAVGMTALGFLASALRGFRGGKKADA